MDSKCAHYISALDLFTNQVPTVIWDEPMKEAKHKIKIGLFLTYLPTYLPTYDLPT